MQHKFYKQLKLRDILVAAKLTGQSYMCN